MQRVTQPWRYIIDHLLPPVQGGRKRLPFFVDPRVSSSGGGMDFHEPFKTMQEAIDVCEDEAFDVIFRLRGTESLTTPILFNKKWITVAAVERGCTSRNKGERFLSYGALGTPSAIVTQPCELEGLGFAGQWIGAASHNFQVLAAGGGFFGGFLKIHNCRFPTWGASPDYAILLKGATNCEFEENQIDGVFEAYNVGGIGFSDSGDGVQVNGCMFRDNVFHNIGENKYAFVHLAGRFPTNNIYQSNILVGKATAIGGAPGAGKFLDNNGCTNYGSLLIDNWIALATDTGSYDDTVANLKTAGLKFAGNHYSE